MQGTLEKTELRETINLENSSQQIFGVLHRPLGIENPPLVVFMHGFASSKHGSNRCYVLLAEHLAKIGIASFRFDFRGCGDSEGSLSDIAFNDLVSDAVAVLDYIESLPGVDAGRLGIFGASLGGAIAVLASALVQNAKAMILWAPVASGELWYRDFLKRYPEHAHTDPSQVLASYRGVRLAPAFRDQFGRMAAYKMASHLKEVPILHMHGAEDDTVSLAHQEAFRGVCEPLNPKTRFVTYAEGEHSLGFCKNFPEIIQESLSWFQTHL